MKAAVILGSSCSKRSCPLCLQEQRLPTERPSLKVLLADYSLSPHSRMSRVPGSDTFRTCVVN
jgi:hypothetical protein